MKIKHNTPAYKKLSYKQRKWVRENFGTTTNSDIAEVLGVSITTVGRIARYAKLKKSAEYIDYMNKIHLHKARVVNKANGYPPKGFKIPGSEKSWFKPGVTSLMRLGAEREALRIEKMKVSRNNTIKAERRRILFGLPQKTRIRLVPESKGKVYARYYLKKRGYKVDDEARVAYYNDATHRGRIIEQRYTRWYKFKEIA